MLPPVLYSTNNVSRPFLLSVYKTSFIHFSSSSDFIICTIICLLSISLLMDILVVFSFVFLFCFYLLFGMIVSVYLKLRCNLFKGSTPVKGRGKKEKWSKREVNQL